MADAGPYAGSAACSLTDIARRSSIPCTWSAWAWVNSTASTRLTPAATSCRRSSGGVSISSRPVPSPPGDAGRVSISAAVRVRLSRGSVDVQVRQEHPIWGTPNEVPVPRKTSRTSDFLDLDEVGAARDLPRDSRRHHVPVAAARVSPLQEQVTHHLQHGIVAGHTVHHDRRHPPHQGQLAEG